MQIFIYPCTYITHMSKLAVLCQNKLWSGPDFADNKSLACVRHVQSVNQQYLISNLPVLVWYLSKSFSHQSSHLSSCVSQQLLFPVFQFSHAIHLPNTASGAWHAITHATAAHHSPSNQSNRTLIVLHLLRTLESSPQVCTLLCLPPINHIYNTMLTLATIEPLLTSHCFCNPSEPCSPFLGRDMPFWETLR